MYLTILHFKFFTYKTVEKICCKFKLWGVVSGGKLELVGTYNRSQNRKFTVESVNFVFS